MSLKTIDLPFNYKKCLDESTNLSVWDQMKEKKKTEEKITFYWTHVAHGASFTFTAYTFCI